MRSSKRKEPVNTDELRARAEAIRLLYLQSLPPDYKSRYSDVADPDKLDMIFRATRAGLRISQACEAAGINQVTIQRWTHLAEANPLGAHAAFVNTLKTLRREGQINRLEKIEAHGDREWCALAWINERTDQETFALQKDKSDGPQVIVQIGVKDSDVRVLATHSPESSDRLLSPVRVQQIAE
jgi:hypothetical protein